MIRPQLLVSVRSVAEAEAALAGGAELIDVKDPSRGALGRADVGVIKDIAAAVRGRVPVSAALGELADAQQDMASFAGIVQYVKWGLAGMVRGTWRVELQRQSDRLSTVCVVVGYADAARADSPSIDDVVDFVCEPSWRSRVLLLDTFDKSQSGGRPLTLLDWLPANRLAEVCSRCRASGVRIALAGSLGEAEVRAVAALRPNWIAVRGAACDRHDRQRGVVAERVRALRRILNQNAPNPAYAG